MSGIAITFATLALMVLMFVTNRVPVAVAALGAAMLLYATGVLSLDQALSGFGDSTVLFIGSLFVVSASLDASGVTASVGQILSRHAGKSPRRLLVLTMLLSAGLAALIGVSGSVAALMPVFDELHHLEITADSPLVGRAQKEIGLINDPGLSLISVQPAVAGGPAPNGVLALGDSLLLRGDPAEVDRFAVENRLPRRGGNADDDVRDALFNTRTGLAEVLIPPRSGLIGQAMFPGMITPGGDLIVLAIQRKSEHAGPGEITLAAGDTLLLQGSWAALDALVRDPDVMVVDQPDLVRRQAVKFGNELDGADHGRRADPAIDREGRPPAHVGSVSKTPIDRNEWAA